MGIVSRGWLLWSLTSVLNRRLKTEIGVKSTAFLLRFISQYIFSAGSNAGTGSPRGSWLETDAWWPEPLLAGGQETCGVGPAEGGQEVRKMPLLIISLGKIWTCSHQGVRLAPDGDGSERCVTTKLTFIKFIQCWIKLSSINCLR